MSYRKKAVNENVAGANIGMKAKLWREFYKQWNLHPDFQADFSESHTSVQYVCHRFVTRGMAGLSFAIGGRCFN